MEKKRINFELLVEKYLNGQLEDQEYGILTELLKDPQNKLQFNQIKDRWKPSSNLKTDSNWNRLSSRINYSLPNKKLSKQFVIGQNWLLRIAAVLVVGLIISTTILYIRNQSYVCGITKIETPRGQKSKVYLPDGSEVWLNANSTISYNTFSKHQRAVKLKGEAYFKIKHDEKAPFTVQTNKCVIKDLGTEFNVMAYDQLNREEVTLFKGSAKVKNNNSEILLKIGDKVLVANGQIQEQKANLEQIHGWVENKFFFHKIPFDELILRLENWYDVDIEYVNKKNTNLVFSGSFKNEETIWEVLDAIKVYIPITYEKIDTRKIKLTVN